MSRMFRGIRSTIETPAPVAAPAVPVETKECSICRDDIPVLDFPTSAPTSTCSHPPSACKGCLARHIEEEVNQKGQTVGVRCPMVSCKKDFDFKDVERWASSEVFNRYDVLVLRRLLQSYDDFRWCKRAECGTGQIHASGAAAPVMTCSECRFKSCFTHDVPWHEGVTCNDFSVMLLNNVDKATTAYFSSVTKPCPSCNKSIEKNGGCDHMTCRRPGGCGHEFCWLCLAPYNEILRRGNHFHRPTCQFYASYNGGDEAEDDD